MKKRHLRPVKEPVEVTAVSDRKRVPGVGKGLMDGKKAGGARG